MTLVLWTFGGLWLYITALCLVARSPTVWSCYWRATGLTACWLIGACIGWALGFVA